MSNDKARFWSSRCRACNESFSLDEEFLACLLDCVLSGSVPADSPPRSKAAAIIAAKPALAAAFALRGAKPAPPSPFRSNVTGSKVVLWLARGHAAFENNEPRLDKPGHLVVCPMIEMSDDERLLFETPPVSDLWPEVGSRALLRRLAPGSTSSRWLNTHFPDESTVVVRDLRQTPEQQGYFALSCHADRGTPWVTAKSAISGSVSTAG